MSDSIRILKINKILDNDLEDTTQDYSTEGFWFEDNLEESISMDFDKTIALKNKSVSKINLVQNANSHFFEPKKANNLDFQKSDIENNSFESINIIDKVIKPADSRIRKEIIDMRRMSFENEQRDKEYLLSKLNVDLKPHNNFKNYNLAKNETVVPDSDFIAEKINQLNEPINQQLQEIEKGVHKIEKVIEDLQEVIKKPILESKPEEIIKSGIDEKITEEITEKKKPEFKRTNFLLKDESIFQEEKNENDKKELVEKELVEKELVEKVEDENTHEFILVSDKLKTKNDKLNEEDKNENKLALVSLEKIEKEVEKNIMVKFDDINHKQNNKDSLIPNKSKKRTLFDEMDTKELNSFFEDDKNSYSLPVINNTDYTVANTVDDLDKAINNLEFGSKKIREKEKFFDQEGGTTQLVEGLQETLKTNKRNSIEPINFDSFENWFNNSKDVKKLTKLAKKENKRMNKTIKK
ncbi:hypothetical protein [Spiroplasma diminutum]|uniref:Uncharacterized protein n=1 Tax=Spiroplasma diminutum CUAS-1 TaxID=1276221 RepID=S5LW15_9MOLU|nr:hypothetical protein [Spiroplasma diminutum]AGR42004.1 hypothetical protein SDIMI_v3c03000 [Spiroplasma diminutum CUAS-1]